MNIPRAKSKGRIFAQSEVNKTQETEKKIYFLNCLQQYVVFESLNNLQ